MTNQQHANQRNQFNISARDLTHRPRSAAPHHTRRHRRALPLGAIGLVLLGACTQDYSIGKILAEASRPGDLPTPAPSADTQVPVALPPPDVTLENQEMVYAANGPTGLDLDGDGAADLVTRGVDDIRIRYGGRRLVDAASVAAFERGGATLTFAQGLSLLIDAASAGDVNGDGFEDLLVTGVDCSNQPLAATLVYLLYGSPERLEGPLQLGQVAVPLRGPSVSEGPGCGGGGERARGVGDLDGDGLADFVISEQRSSRRMGDLEISVSHLFYGRTAPLLAGTFDQADAHLTLSHTRPATVSQEVIVPVGPQRASALGDVNGDGDSDLALELGGWWGMQAFFLAGSPARLTGSVNVAERGFELGGSVGPAPVDLDGDGMSDVLLVSGSSLAIHYGKRGLALSTEAPDVVLTRDSPFNFAQFASLGDMDADGDDEIATLAAPPDDAGFWLTRVAAVLSGQERLRGTRAFPLEAALTAQPGGPFPNEVQSASRTTPAGGRAIDWLGGVGDLDGDGRDDVASLSLFYEVNRRSISGHGLALHIHYGAPEAARPDILR